jgi:hypothetical protein
MGLGLSKTSRPVPQNEKANCLINRQLALGCGAGGTRTKNCKKLKINYLLVDIYQVV